MGTKWFSENKKDCTGEERSNRNIFLSKHPKGFFLYRFLFHICISIKKYEDKENEIERKEEKNMRIYFLHIGK